MSRATQLLAAVFSTMCLASCLITSDPNFSPPEPTAPYFLPDSATPDLRSVITIESTEQELLFTGFIRSEDGDSGLKSALYLDYGSPNPGDDRVYRDKIDGNKLEAASWDTPNRLAQAKWRRGDFTMAPGCHRFTLMVVHDDFDDVGCPVTKGDYAVQSWNVLVCDSNGMCPPFADCPEIVTKCPPDTGTNAATTGTSP